MRCRHTTYIYLYFFFFFNDTATTEIYTLSLHDALPISIRLRAERAGEAGRDQRTRGHRPRPPGHRFRRVTVPRDGGDERRLRCDRRLANPQRAAQYGVGGGVGLVPSRRRRGHRKLAARGASERSRRVGVGGAATRARAHQRSRHRCGTPRGCGVRRRTGRRAPSWDPAPDAGGGGGRLSTLLVGARQIVTCRGPARARRGWEMTEVEVLHDAAVLIEGERIVWVGPRSEARDLHSAFRIPQSAIDVVEVTGVLFPGFVDCHTHAVFGGPRLDDHERRALGEDYKTVAARGGGILQSVRDVRARSESDLVALMRARVRALLASGSTTIEVKSGYGLDPERDRKQLRAIRETAGLERAALVPTFLAAHEVPPEFGDRRADYVRLVCEEMIPAVARQQLATACDVFCEPGVFDIAETRTILTAAQRHGSILKLHADALEASAGAELAAALGALSADHLAAISDAGIRAL